MPNEVNAGALSLDALFPDVYRLNFRLVGDIEESRVPSVIPAALRPLLIKTPRIQERLTRFLEKELDLGPAVFDFRDRTWCVALFDRATLAALVRTLGAALHWEWIGKTIDRPTVKALKESLGTTAYDYALRRAPFLRIPARNPFNAKSPSGALGEFFDRCGTGCLASGLTAAPPELLRRLQLKLRYDLTFESGMPAPDSPASSLAQSLIPRIAGEMESKWSHLFA